MSVAHAPQRREVELLVTARDAGRSGRGRELREAASLSQTEAASFCDVTAATISLWESGKRRPTGEAASRYGQLLELVEAILEARFGQSPQTRAPAIAGTKGTRENTDDDESSAPRS